MSQVLMYHHVSAIRLTAPAYREASPDCHAFTSARLEIDHKDADGQILTTRIELFADGRNLAALTPEMM